MVVLINIIQDRRGPGNFFLHAPENYSSKYKNILLYMFTHVQIYLYQKYAGSKDQISCCGFMAWHRAITCNSFCAAQAKVDTVRKKGT